LRSPAWAKARAMRWGDAFLVLSLEMGPSEHTIAGTRIGERTPFLTGVRRDRTFYSFNDQAGRPAALIHLGLLAPADAAPVIAAFAERLADFDNRGADALCLIDASTPHAEAFTALPQRIGVVFCPAEALRPWLFDSLAPSVAVVDRNARLVASIVSTEPRGMAETALRALAACPIASPRDEPTPAPVLFVPNVLSAELCRRLVEHFDSEARVAGGMAAVDARGKPFHKIDESKKRRQDCVVKPHDPIYQLVLEALSRACLPEVKRAFQFDAAFVDRLLVARYDETGGYFRRHRDNAAPAVAFRQFAISINLNTGEYEGGHLLFPEYSDYRYKPEVGGAAVFSATLLHEAAPVLRGARYVLLTFLHNAESEARRRSAA
jgi:predicted 2-oxoglutarate/Fe(II)-dependent dioxygenase YbiX